MFEQAFKNIDDILHKDVGCSSELDYHKALSGDDLKDFVALQKPLVDSENSWTLNVADVSPETFDLSVKNPCKKEEAGEIMHMIKEIL